MYICPWQVIVARHTYHGLKKSQFQNQYFPSYCCCSMSCPPENTDIPQVRCSVKLHDSTEGIFTPIAHLLWSKSVDELAVCVRFFFSWCEFTRAKCQANQNLTTKSQVRAAVPSLFTNCMVFISAIYQAKIKLWPL